MELIDKQSLTANFYPLRISLTYKTPVFIYFKKPTANITILQYQLPFNFNKSNFLQERSTICRKDTVYLGLSAIYSVENYFSRTSRGFQWR